MNRDISYSEWREREQNQPLSNLGPTQLPRQLDLIPETSERLMSFDQSSSNVLEAPVSSVPQLHSKASAPAAVNAMQPQEDQQTNGGSHTSEWTHHSSLMKAYQPAT